MVGILDLDSVSSLHYVFVNTPLKEFKKSYFTTSFIYVYYYSDDIKNCIDGYKFSTRISSVPSFLRQCLREVLIEEILPIIKKWQSCNNKNHTLVVNYSKHHKFSGGGLYVIQDYGTEKQKEIFNKKDFDIDDKIKELI